jgi:hypothetical protein
MHPLVFIGSLKSTSTKFVSEQLTSFSYFHLHFPTIFAPFAMRSFARLCLCHLWLHATSDPSLTPELELEPEPEQSEQLLGG